MFRATSPGRDWRYVMPSNFNQFQIINDDGRVEWPWGPLTVDSGFSSTWLASWIVQGGPQIPMILLLPRSRAKHQRECLLVRFSAGLLACI